MEGYASGCCQHNQQPAGSQSRQRQAGLCHVRARGGMQRQSRPRALHPPANELQRFFVGHEVVPTEHEGKGEQQDEEEGVTQRPRCCLCRARRPDLPLPGGPEHGVLRGRPDVVLQASGQAVGTHSGVWNS